MLQTKRLPMVLLLLVLVVAMLSSAGCAQPQTPVVETEPPAEPEEASLETEPTAKPESAADSEVAESEPVTLVWWNDYDDAETKELVLEYVINPFNESHSDIQIEFVPKGDYDRVLRTALASGKGPDLYNTHGPAYSMQYAADGLALSLEPYVEKYGWDQLLMKWALDASRYQGEVYSIPVTTESVFLWYNKTMFEANGWTPPTSWEELDTLCTEMTAAGIIPFAFGASDFRPANEWWLTLAFNYYAGRDNVAKALRGELPWNSEVLVGAVDRLNYMWQNGYISAKKTHELSMADAWGLWANQEAAMRGAATWMIRYLDIYSEGFEWDFTRHPTWREEAPNRLIVGIGANIAVNPSSEKTDAAAEFLNWLVSDPKRAAEITIGVEGELWIPVRMERDDFPATAHPMFLKVIDQFNEIPPDEPGLSMWTFWPPETESYLYENIERVWLGQMTPQELMDEAQVIFERELEAGKVPPIPGK